MELATRVCNKFVQFIDINESRGGYEDTFFETQYLTVYILGWPITNSKSIRYHIYCVFTRLMLVILFAAEVWNLLTETKRLADIIDKLNVILTLCITLYRYKNLVDNKDIYRKLASAMDSKYFDANTEKRKELVKFWASKNCSFKYLSYFGFVLISLWNFYASLDKMSDKMPMPIRLPFNYQTDIRFAITYVVAFYTFNFSLFVLASDVLMQSYLLHLLCQYAVLNDCFINIMDECLYEGEERKELYLNEPFVKKYSGRLNELIERHEFILKNTVELKKTLSFPLLGQLVISTTLICVIAFQVSEVIKTSIHKFLMSVFSLIYALFELFIFCKWCNEITVQSEKIAEGAYSSGWEKGLLSRVPGARDTILIIMNRAQYPVIFTAGGFFKVTLATYTTLVKTSYSAFTVLQRIY